MFFQFEVSPTKQVKKQQPVITPLEEVAVLKLAPFSPNPKIFFENVAVGDVETKKLIIQNPNPFNSKVIITKFPPANRFVALSWKEIEISAQDETVLELTWAPKEEGGWRDVLCIRDNQNVNRNIAIVFKSIPKKGKRRTVSKQTAKTKPTVVAVPPVKKFRSPKNTKKKRSPLKQAERVCMPISYKCENCENNIHITTCSPVKKKPNIKESNKENSPVIFHNSENLSPIVFQQKADNVSFSRLSLSEKLNRINNSSFFSSPSTINFKCDNILQTPIRRDTYLVKSPDIFNDSLELEKKLDNLELTPELFMKRNKSSDSFTKKLNIDATPEMSITKRLDNIELTPEISKSRTSPLSDTFIKKLNMDFTPELSVTTNKSRTSDNFLVQKYLSDSVAFSTATVTKKTSQFKLLLNDSEVIEEIFLPNDCSTDTKKQDKINKHNTSTPKELFTLNNTYERTPANKKNFSPNLSGETYTVSNISSSSTYDILSLDDINTRIREITDNEKQVSSYTRISTSSPLLSNPTDQFHATSNYLNFSGINAKTALSCIIEEDKSTDSFRNSSIRSDLSNNGLKRKSNQPEILFTVSPPKRAFLKPKSPKPVKNINTSWNKKLEKTEKIRRKSVSTLRLNLSKVSTKSNTSNVSDTSTISVNSTQTSCHIDPFLIAAMYNSDTSTVNSNLDPFISSTLYYDEKWLDKQMQELKKWLNAILTPPSELAATAESKKVDVAKLWQDCVKKDLIYAPTKEKVSSKYHTNHKLEVLRKSAKNLFHSLDMRNVLSKVTITIENKQMTIRDDKNLHLDVGLQSHILTLLLCYNPLWLRIGLETIYNEPIPLDSNSDIIGLSTFIMLRFFRCPDLMPKNKQQTSHIKYLPTYGAAIKKFTLKKFIMLIYFLDQAKTKKLISHDPCLFCRDAPVKESKEILLSFSRELLSAVGDITKFLRRLGYEVSHKQSYIDEFDYAVKNLGVDLRDGIRLTKVMEIILMRNDLTNQLRGPAISRLQKIHNVKLALDSLIQAGYTIAGEITPKDIVDGHREKTLSLLWQIIYKFQAPRFTAAAIKIQIWWKSLRIVIKRRILDRPRQLRINACIKIQKFYRSWKFMLKERTEFLCKRKSAVAIQKFTRSMFLMKRDRLQYLLKKQAVTIIQQRYRALKLMKKERHDYLEKKNSAILIQRYFRAKLTMRETRETYLKLKNVVIKMQRNFRSKQIVKEQRNNFLEKRIATVTLQRRFRATQQMKADRNTYLRTKSIIIKLQQRFRATILMREVRHTYLEQRRSIILLQQKYRATILMKEVRKSYLKQKQAAITIQQRFRAHQTMKQVKENYLQQKQSVITIQRTFRAYLEMKQCRENYLKLKQATVILQQRFRATILMKTVREDYLKQKEATVIIQQKFRAYLEMKECRENYLLLKQTTVQLQQKFRANILMKTIRKEYLTQRNATIYIQQKFRASLEMKKCRTQYLNLKKATISVQERFRANQVMKQVRQNYLQQRKAAVFIQEKCRAYLEMKKCRENYVILKLTTIAMQQKFRANLKMKKYRISYLELKKATISIQERFRANQVMKQVRQNYLQQRKAALTIQDKCRAYLEMKKCRENYLILKQTTIALQQKFRANRLMKSTREDYLRQRHAAVKIQQKFRAHMKMKKCRTNYLELKKATIYIQERFRANQVMKQVRQNYLQQRKAALTIQEKCRAYLEMKKCRENYLILKQTTITMQQKFRATRLMKTTREDYLKQRHAAVKIQQKFRAYLEMKKCRENYLMLKQTTITMQQKFRATRLMKTTRENYLKQRHAVVKIQQKLRAYLEMKKCRENYLMLKQTTVDLQQKFRATMLMKTTREDYLKQRHAAVKIQQKFRAYLEMKKCREYYLRLKQTTVVLQQKFRATMLMKTTREDYLKQRHAAVKIQQKLRAYLEMKKCRENYLMLKQTTVILQQRFRATILMKTVRANYIKQREATVKIQKQFRAYLEMKECRGKYLILKQTTIQLQQRFRANILMKTVREDYLKQRYATIYIQQKFRANLEMKKCRTNYLELKKATISVQERFRANQVMKQVRQYYLQQRKAALTIQEQYRAYSAMKNARNYYLKLKQVTVVVQQRFRANMLMKTVRENYLKQLDAAICIQQRFRAYLEMKRYRRNYLEQRKAAIIIQERFKVYLIMKICREEFIKNKLAVIKIQRYFRAYLNRCLVQKLELKIKAVIKIQSWVRMHAAKKQFAILLENSKDTEEKKEERRRNNAAVKIQALWRGYSKRKVMCKKMAIIRQRSEDAANNAAPQFTVGQRNREAIDLLMYQTSMKEIIRALTILDFTTRLFPNLCIEVCDEIAERLYILLVCTNRSVPDMDVSILCVSVLINLYKFQQTSAAVWKVQYVERLFSVLLHWSDKDCILFPYVCTLIWLFAQKKEYCEILKAENNVDKILKKTYQQCERRQKMLTRMRNAPVSIPVKGQKDIFPSLVPDWGIINVNRPRVFRNPVFAIKCLLKKLNITLSM